MSDENLPTLIERAELIPANAPIMSLAQQVDFAQYMAKAKISLPSHFHGNVGDCLAVLDIATRAGLSPYMFANKTYVQNGRLCFESQLFHGLLVQSGRLKGDLRVKYDGEGDNRTCTVWGTLRGETEPHSYTSPPLKDLHPGHTTKDGRKFVKGSPLWDSKPDVQMFYDTSRDWTRMFCPTAVMGIYTPDEIEAYDIEPSNMRPGLHARLTANKRPEEGFKHDDAHVERELSQASETEKPSEKPADALKPETGAEVAPQPAKRRGRPPKAVAETPVEPVTTLTNPATLPSDASVKAAADRAEKASAMRRAEAEMIEESRKPRAPEPPKQPTNPAEYMEYATRWIATVTNADDLEARWDGERDMREDMRVPIAGRNKLTDLLSARIRELKP